MQRLAETGRPACRRKVLAAFGALVLPLAGCVTVPTSGPVEHHNPQASGVNSAVRVDPFPPSDGASQLLVVEGFLHAMGTYQPDYAVARQYLTAAAAESWRPESGVQVYADGFPPTETEQSVVLSARITGTIDAQGSYTVASEAVRHDFGLVKDDAGQWRISDPPDGLLVSRYAFTTGFSALNLYFLDPEGTVLVPEPRFFAAGDQALLAAAKAQVRGPSPWLAPAVRKLPARGVEVLSVSLDELGTVEVSLSEAAGAFDADQRSALLAELSYALGDFGTVNAVRVLCNGETWQDKSGQAVVGPASFAKLSPVGASPQRSLFVIKDKKVQRLNDMANWTDLTELKVGFAKPEHLAVNAGTSEVAAVVGGGTKLQIGHPDSDKTTTMRKGKALLRPEYARNGELWSPASGGLGEFQVFDHDRRLKVSTGTRAVPKLKVKAISLSPDSVRVALILRDGTRTRLGIARLQRSAGQVIVSGWRVLDLSSISGNPAATIDVGWITATELVVLQESDSGTGVFRVSQDGASAVDIGPSENASLAQLAVVPLRPMAARGPTGNVYRRDGEFNWNLAISDVDAMAYSAEPVDE